MKWKPVIGYEGFYEVSENGDVINSLKGFILKQSNSHGYRTVKLTKEKIRKTMSVHRLVASSYLLRHNNENEINHINGLKHDNRSENLEWCDRKHNVSHANNMGLVNYAKKLDGFKVLTIITLVNSGIKRSHVAKMMGISGSTVTEVMQGKTWKNVRI